ncbi:MAG: hypothetical protein VX596_07525, partial [Pseudomonadota bacterium]|nr:hypothetical protein [Pseudomonadota bacterium]
ALALGLILPLGTPRAPHQGSDSLAVIALSFECLVIVLKRNRRYVIAWWQRGIWPRLGDEIVGNINPEREGRSGGRAPNILSGSMDHNGPSWRVGVTLSTS